MDLNSFWESFFAQFSQNCNISNLSSEHLFFNLVLEDLFLFRECNIGDEYEVLENCTYRNFICVGV